MITISKKRVEKIYEEIDHNYKEIEKLHKEIGKLNKEILLDKIVHRDHIQGTNMEEWECTLCKSRYSATRPLCCPKCVIIE